MSFLQSAITSGLSISFAISVCSESKARVDILDDCFSKAHNLFFSPVLYCIIGTPSREDASFTTAYNSESLFLKV